jgi:hypothetical protein
VYRHARSSDLRDLRLFDHQGNLVPFALTTPPNEEKVSFRSVPVTIFPVRAEEGSGKLAAGLDIRTSPDGTLVSVNAHVAGAAAPASRLSALVLDTRATATPGKEAPELTALRLTLPPNVANYTARIEVEVSDDLQHWTSLGQSLVSWLTNSDTKAIASDRIEFDPQAFRYARLSWREGAPLEFASIAAEVRLQAEARPVMETLTLAPLPGKFVGDVMYQSALAIPVKSVGLQFAEQNIVVPALIGRYIELPNLKRDQPKRWDFAPGFRATFFQLTQAGRIRTSGDVDIGNAHVAQWVLRPQAALTNPPSLRIAWQPASMIFVANGKVPYQLAVGRDSANSVQADISRVVPNFDRREMSALEQAVAGAIVLQHPVAASSSEAEVAGTSARNRMMMLWGVLLLGLAVLGSMVWGLVKQMRT